MKTVIILKQIGETGLRTPGTPVLLPDEQAKQWIEKGWAKEDKTTFETKEEKFTQKVKETKRKRVIKTKIK